MTPGSGYAQVKCNHFNHLFLRSCWRILPRFARCSTRGSAQHYSRFWVEAAPLLPLPSRQVSMPIPCWPAYAAGSALVWCSRWVGNGMLGGSRLSTAAPQIRFLCLTDSLRPKICPPWPRASIPLMWWPYSRLMRKPPQRSPLMLSGAFTLLGRASAGRCSPSAAQRPIAIHWMITSPPHCSSTLNCVYFLRKPKCSSMNWQRFCAASRRLSQRRIRGEPTISLSAWPSRLLCFPCENQHLNQLTRHLLRPEGQHVAEVAQEVSSACGPLVSVPCNSTATSVERQRTRSPVRYPVDVLRMLRCFPETRCSSNTPCLQFVSRSKRIKSRPTVIRPLKISDIPVMYAVSASEVA